MNHKPIHDPRCTVFNTCARTIFHYTSVETLALILKNKTIRFNRLDRVNDPREAVSEDYAKAQTLVFASCWTDYPDESIPLWKLYADLSGVRICLPTLMFNGRHNNHKVTKDDRLYEINLIDCSYSIERRGKKFHGLSGSVIYGPTKIQYGDADQLTGKHVHPERSDRRFDIRTLGTQKHKHWVFEQEVRFRILAAMNYASEKGSDYMSPESFSDSPVMTEFVDVRLDSSVFDEMEILLGPCATAAQRIIVDSLCKEYAPGAKICESEIHIRPHVNN